MLKRPDALRTYSGYIKTNPLKTKYLTQSTLVVGSTTAVRVPIQKPKRALIIKQSKLKFKRQKAVQSVNMVPQTEQEPL